MMGGSAAQAVAKGEAMGVAPRKATGRSTVKGAGEEGGMVVEGAGHEPSLYRSREESLVCVGERTGEGPEGEVMDGLERDGGEGGGAIEGSRGGLWAGEVGRGGGQRSGCVGTDGGTGDGLEGGDLLRVMNLGGGCGGDGEGIGVDVAEEVAKALAVIALQGFVMVDKDGNVVTTDVILECLEEERLLDELSKLGVVRVAVTMDEELSTAGNDGSGSDDG